MGEMLSWHKVGQKIVCIDDRPITKGFGFEIRPSYKAIYTIRSVDEWGFTLVEIVNKIGDYCEGCYEARYNPDRFRPVRDTNIDCFLSLLTPSPDTVRKLEEVR